MDWLGKRVERAWSPWWGLGAGGLVNAQRGGGKPAVVEK
jgi:hypothetical protein